MTSKCHFMCHVIDHIGSKKCCIDYELAWPLPKNASTKFKGRHLRTVQCATYQNLELILFVTVPFMILKEANCSSASTG